MGDCLIILGMHRSGTSAMAGVAKLLGVYLGSRLMGPRKGENECGFFEYVDSHDFHEFGEKPLWCAQDPRLCRLLPLWLPVLERAGIAVSDLGSARSGSRPQFAPRA